MSTNATHTETPAEAPVEEPAPDTQDTAEADPKAEAPDNAPEDEEDDRGDIAKARAQAAKYRARLRETEQQRDALSERLSQADDHIIGYALASAGVDPRLWQVSDVDLDALRTESGHLDIAKVIAAAEDVRVQVFGPARPNPQQGIPSQARPAPSLKDAFAPKGPYKR